MNLLGSALTNIHGVFKGALYSGIYSETKEDIADGGPTCYNKMTVDLEL